MRLSASLSPPQLPQDGRSRKRTPSVVMPEIDLSRDSPFGPLSQISARRTFAYLIATLNATHPDYDFSNMLRPADFHRITGTAIRRIVDSTLMNMRPRRMSNLLTPPMRTQLTTSPSQASVAPMGDSAWNERMWKMIDQEMDLRHCEKYSWVPEDDPFEAESALWTQHYFFFSKEKKRVCYLNFRAFSVLSHSPVHNMSNGRGVSLPRSINNITIGEGAGKRAQYWLGHSYDDDDDEMKRWGEDDDDEMETIKEDLENDEEYVSALDDVRDQLEDGYYDAELDDAEVSGWNHRSKSIPRGSSEGPADAMEI